MAKSRACTSYIGEILSGSAAVISAGAGIAGSILVPPKIKDLCENAVHLISETFAANVTTPPLTLDANINAVMPAQIDSTITLPVIGQYHLNTIANVSLENIQLPITIDPLTTSLNELVGNQTQTFQKGGEQAGGYCYDIALGISIGTTVLATGCAALLFWHSRTHRKLNEKIDALQQKYAQAPEMLENMEEGRLSPNL